MKRRFARLRDLRSDWQDLTTAGLAALAFVLCFGAGVFRLSRGDRVAAVILLLISLVVAVCALALAVRKLANHR